MRGPLTTSKKAPSWQRRKANQAARAQSLMHMGYARTKSGDLEQAIKLLDQAGDIYRETDDQYGLQKLHDYMSIYYGRAGEQEKSISEQLRSLELSTENKDTSSMIVSHLNLLSRYAMAGNVEKAFYHYEERNRLIDMIEYPEDRKIDLNIGVLYVQSEQYRKAIEVLDKCQEYYRKEGNTYRVALIDHWKAIALPRIGPV